MNELPKLRDTQKNCMARLSSYLLAMRSGSGDLSQTIEKPTRSAPIRIDAAQVADAGSDIGGGQGPTAC